MLIAQDNLNTLGFRTGGLDGIFGKQTTEAVRSYQRSRGLGADGIIGCNTWRSLQEDVVGTGRTATTLDYKKEDEMRFHLLFPFMGYKC